MQFRLKLRSHFLIIFCIRGNFRDNLSAVFRWVWFGPGLFDTAGQQSVDYGAEDVETAADKEHMHPLFTRALHCTSTMRRLIPVFVA